MSLILGVTLESWWSALTTLNMLAYGDLHLDDTMVLGEPGSSRMAGVVDWDQAGWHREFGSETVHSDSDCLSLECQK
jgi:hypothetical protein